MPSRISGACNGCRTKKQKCSGDRAGCTQCLAAGMQCTWPEQRKRGPAKGYIEGLEHRLHEAESLLLALLPNTSSEQLKYATDALFDSFPSTNTSGPKTRDSQSPGPQGMRSSPPILNKKTGIEYWESFPLDSIENIRKWQEDCASHSNDTNAQNQSSFRNSIDGAHSHDHILANLNNTGSHSRTSSVDFSHHGNRERHSRSQPQAEPFRSMSTDSYTSGPNTPLEIPQQSFSQSSLPNASSNQHRQPSQPHQPQTSINNWSSLSLFSPNTNNSSPITHTSSPNGNGMTAEAGAEAMLLQAFGHSSWAQSQNINTGMNGGDMNGSMIAEPGAMEIDSGFFTNDMTRRLFW